MLRPGCKRSAYRSSGPPRSRPTLPGSNASRAGLLKERLHRPGRGWRRRRLLPPLDADDHIWTRRIRRRAYICTRWPSFDWPQVRAWRRRCSIGRWAMRPGEASRSCASTVGRATSGSGGTTSMQASSRAAKRCRIRARRRARPQGLLRGEVREEGALARTR